MDLVRIEAVLRLLQRQDHVGEVSVDGEGWRFRARKGQGPPLRLPLDPGSPGEESPGDNRIIVRSGLVGIYRAAPKSPRRGEFVPKGTTLGNIDSMRILNPVVAEEPGFLEESFVEDGYPVEYGQELFALAPDEPSAAG